MLRLKDLFDDNSRLIFNMEIASDWATSAVKTEIDYRLLTVYAEKPIDKTLAKDTEAAIRQKIYHVLLSKAYELDTLYKTTIQEYAPLENYNMTESWTDTMNGTSHGSSEDTTTTYNSDTKRATGGNTADGTVNNTSTHSATRFGNLGVTTSQQMLMSERDVAHFDFIEYVCNIINSYVCSCFWRGEDDNYSI